MNIRMNGVLCCILAFSFFLSLFFFLSLYSFTTFSFYPKQRIPLYPESFNIFISRYPNTFQRDDCRL